jgi:hypothetical protein
MSRLADVRGMSFASAARGGSMADNNTPNQNANKSKAEGERLGPEESSATRAAERNEVASNYDDASGDDAGGITNRPYGEERQNQEALPARGTSRDDGRNLGVGDAVESNREDRRSER